MNAQELVKEYQYLDAKQRQEFLVNITEIETVKNSQFNAAKDALSELQRGDYKTYHNGTELINDI